MQLLIVGDAILCFVIGSIKLSDGIRFISLIAFKIGLLVLKLKVFPHRLSGDQLPQIDEALTSVKIVTSFPVETHCHDLLCDLHLIACFGFTDDAWEIYNLHPILSEPSASFSTDWAEFAAFQTRC